MQNISRKKIIIALAAFSAVIFLIMLFIRLSQDTKQNNGRDEFKGKVGSEEYLTGDSVLPNNERQREVNIENKNGLQTITNVYDGYRISASESWDIVEEVHGGLRGLRLIYDEGGEHGTVDNTVAHLHADMVANVLVFENKEGFSLADWLNTPEEVGTFFSGAQFTRMQHPLYLVHRTQEPLTEDRFVNGEFVGVPLSDTLSVKYLIKDPDINTIYVLVCTINTDVQELTSVCADLVPSFEILQR